MAKIKLEELADKNWKDTGVVYANLMILEKGNERILYDPRLEKIFNEYQCVENYRIKGISCPVNSTIGKMGGTFVNKYE